MPRKKRVKESSEPVAVAEILEQSPVAAIIAEHEAKPDTHAEAVTSFQRQREREQAVAEPERATEPVPTSFADAVKASRSAFGPIPDGFVNVDSYPEAGLKVNRSLDRKIAAIQFAEDRLPTRAEKDIMQAVSQPESSLVYKTARRQWERFDAEQPGANLIDAKRVAGDMAREREGRVR
jgi:hypothetical protein